MYVERKFGPAQKAGARDMVDRIEAAFAAELDDLEWMDAPTKARARDKLHLIANKIGYPDRWRDYSGLELSRTSPLEEGHDVRIAVSARAHRPTGRT